MTEHRFAPRGERLGARVTRLEEDATALSDTLLEIRDTVDGHTADLAALQGAVSELQGTVNGHTTELAAIHDTLNGHTTELARIQGTLDGHAATLGQHTEMLTEILRRLPPAV